MKNKIIGYFMFYKKHYDDIKKLRINKRILLIIKSIITVSLLMISGIINSPNFLPILYEKMEIMKL